MLSHTGSLRREDTSNYSPDRRNLGHARGDTYLAAMADVYAACAAVLRPGGFLVLVTKDMRSDGALRNLSGETIQLCQDTGLRYWQRVIGLLATVHDSELVMPLSVAGTQRAACPRAWRAHACSRPRGRAGVPQAPRGHASSQEKGSLKR
jgi:hypothetical protein